MAGSGLYQHCLLQHRLLLRCPERSARSLHLHFYGLPKWTEEVSASDCVRVRSAAGCLRLVWSLHRSFSGILADKLGSRWTLFGFRIFFPGDLFSYSTHLENEQTALILMLLGRLIFGVGNCSAEVITSRLQNFLIP